MDETLLREQMETARQAEEFLNYLEQYPYLKGLLERMKLTLAQWILLLPADSTEFLSIKTRYDFVDEVLNAVRGDISLGQSSLKKLEGGDDKKGLL